MTRKDYKLLALAMAEAYAYSDACCMEGYYNTLEILTKRLQVDNPGFDKRRFFDAIDACRGSNVIPPSWREK